MEVKWGNRITTFTGRNGTFQCTGLVITPLATNQVIIEPITSKNETGRCSITIPEEDIPNVCSGLAGDLLRLVMDNIDQKELPALLGLNKILDKLIGERLKK